jgi:hypothetical protein
LTKSRGGATWRRRRGCCAHEHQEQQERNCVTSFPYDSPALDILVLHPHILGAVAEVSDPVLLELVFVKVLYL